MCFGVFVLCLISVCVALGILLVVVVCVCFVFSFAHSACGSPWCWFGVVYACCCAVCTSLLIAVSWSVHWLCFPGILAFGFDVFDCVLVDD